MPAIDSRDVNKEIKLQIRPLLQRAGFLNFTSRYAWRYRENQIDVLNFQSFNSYFAEVVGCTTYSFAVNLGCYLTYVPEMLPNNPIKVKKNTLIPEEYRCHIRRQLRRQISQPELKRTDIWYVDPGRKYLGPAVYDAALVIEGKLGSGSISGLTPRMYCCDYKAQRIPMMLITPGVWETIHRRPDPT